MSVQILLITHELIGAELLKVTRNTYGRIPINTEVITIDYKTNPDKFIPIIETTAKKLASPDGILILTDLYGSTPCNIALTLTQHHHVEVIAGLNLPMLLKVMNYPTLNLHQLAQKAISGGKEGVVNCRFNSE